MADYNGGGFIMLRRQFQNACAYRDPEATLVYVHCQMRANISSVIVRGVRLQRGQFLTTMDDFGNECGMNESKIRRVLKRLENEGLIVRESPEHVTEKATEKMTKKATDKVTDKATKKGTVITVVNYGLTGYNTEKSDGESDGESDEESDGQSDGQSDDSIIIDNIKPRMENKEQEDIEDPADKEATGKGHPLGEDDHVAFPSASSDFFVKNPDVLQYAKFLEDNGFRYSSHGKGGLPAYLTRQLKFGYTMHDIITAFSCMQKEGLDNINSHIGYMSSVLGSMYENGECEHGFFHGKREKVKTNSKAVCDAANQLLDLGFKLDHTGLKGLVAKLEWIQAACNDDDGLQVIVDECVRIYGDNPEEVKNLRNYLNGLFRDLYPYEYEEAP